VIGLCLLAAATAGSQQEAEEQELLQVLEGFDDESETSETEPAAASGERMFRLGGHLKLGTSYALHHHTDPAGLTDWHGLSRLRPELQLETELRPSQRWRLFASGRANTDLAFRINGHDRYTEQVLERYEHDLELLETYLAVDLGGGVDLTVGRQIVAWGTSENLRVTDVINPLDLREPGLADIEELRLPLAMTRLDINIGAWSLSGLAVHEIRFDRTPAYGHDLYPYPIPLPVEQEPANTLDSAELGLAARGSFSGWDLSFYLARVFNDTPHLELEWGPGSYPRPVLRHSRLEMLGMAWDLAAGDYLVKAEAAHLRGLSFYHRPDEGLARSDLLLGLEYAGFDETSITVEVVGRHLHDFSPELELSPDLAQENQLDWVVRVTRTFLHQTLMVTLVSMQLGLDGDGGALQRLEARYDVNDRLEVVTGIVLYRSGERPGFATIGDGDRLFLDLTYRF
jgi:hypothetical protein